MPRTSRPVLPLPTDDRRHAFVYRSAVARRLRNGHEPEGYVTGRYVHARYVSAAWHAFVRCNDTDAGRPYADGWGVVVAWEDDNADADRSWEEDSGYDGPCDYEACYLTLYYEGQPVASASLSGIVDADDGYRASVVASLASEAAREAGLSLHVVGRRVVDVP